MAMTRVSLVLSLLFVSLPLAAQSIDSGDWPYYNRTPYGQRFSPLGEINTSNVTGLRRICSVDIPEGKSFQSGIIAVDGTLYATTDMATYAIDGSNCAIKWRHDHRYDPPSMLGAAYHDGRLFRGAVAPTAGGLTFTADLNGTVYALSSRNGRKLWTGNAGQPVGGGVISYLAGDRQRIAIAAGMKSPIWPVNTTGARVVVFGLP